MDEPVEITTALKSRSSSIAFDAETSWEEFQDPVTARHFYYNRTTGRSTWVRPADMMLPQEEISRELKKRSSSVNYDPASQWEQFWDSKTGRHFFYHRTLGLSQWERPEEMKLVNTKGNVSKLVKQRSTSIGYSEETAWETFLDPATGLQFYYNRTTGESTWTTPEALKRGKWSGGDVECDE